MSTQMKPAESQAMPPEAFLTEVAFGALMSQALYVAARLAIADLLAEKPQSVEQLAAATETHERSLYRVLRSLSSIGVFEEVGPKVFALTPVGEALRSDAPNSVRNGIIFMGEEWHWRVWGNLIHSVKTGGTAWKKTHGVEVFDYFSANPENAEIFNRAMTDMSVVTAPAVIEAYDFSGFKTIADIAGGHGFMLSQILKATPGLRGILFDMPHVIEGATALLQREEVADRVERVAGDFFASVPSADAYTMKHIIHDWDDERSVKILSNIREAMNPGAKVLIVEVVVPEGNEPHYSKVMDLEMLASPGGVERTAKEYEELLAQAGLKLTRIIQTKSPFSVIESVKA